MTQEEFKVLKETLKVVFAGYKRIDAKMAQRLRTLGFSMIRQKNHCIFSYYVNGKGFSWRWIKLRETSGRELRRLVILPGLSSGK